MKKILLFVFYILAGFFIFANPIKVSCVGNSITYGYLLHDREENAYPSQLQRMLGSEYEVRNFGHSGATLLNKGHRPYIKTEEYKQALEFAGNIVVIHLGINDTDPRNWPNYRDCFVNDYLDLIQSFRDVNPDTRIMIARMTPLSERHPRFESGTRDWHHEIQEAIEIVAEISKSQLIDFYEPSYPYSHQIHDAVHPDKDGATILAKTVYSSITGDFGGLQMPNIYSDNMVMQRGIPFEISGVANSGDKITVEIEKQKIITHTADNGKWSVTLKPLKVGKPFTLKIKSSTQNIEYKNILAGEVWLASGQSNMEFELINSHNGREVAAMADNSQIRLYDMKANWRADNVTWSQSALDSINQLHYLKDTTWRESREETSSHFSAIAYHFAKMLQDSLQVPVGMICNAVGGSSTESWINREVLENEFPAIQRNWLDNDFIQEWVRGRAKKNMGEDRKPLQRHPYEPGYMYDVGIRPISAFPIAGVIWYQGESNAHNKDAHYKLFKLLVSSWRSTWNHEELPFYFAQLSSIDRPSWPWFRDSQRRLSEEILYSGMIVSSDVGDSLDVHPIYKQEVGERFGKLALNKTYLKSNITPSGPLYKNINVLGTEVEVVFDYADGLATSDGDEPTTFEVAEYKGMFYPARATIVGNKVVLSSPEVSKPKYVRYGWQPFTNANLINRAGLPASTFTTE